MIVSRSVIQNITSMLQRAFTNFSNNIASDTSRFFKSGFEYILLIHMLVLSLIVRRTQEFATA